MENLLGIGSNSCQSGPQMQNSSFGCFLHCSKVQSTKQSPNTAPSNQIGRVLFPTLPVFETSKIRGLESEVVGVPGTADRVANQVHSHS